MNFKFCLANTNHLHQFGQAWPFFLQFLKTVAGINRRWTVPPLAPKGVYFWLLSLRYVPSMSNSPPFFPRHSSGLSLTSTFPKKSPFALYLFIISPARECQELTHFHIEFFFMKISSSLPALWSFSVSPWFADYSETVNLGLFSNVFNVSYMKKLRHRMLGIETEENYDLSQLFHASYFSPPL